MYPNSSGWNIINSLSILSRVNTRHNIFDINIPGKICCPNLLGDNGRNLKAIGISTI